MDVCRLSQTERKSLGAGRMASRTTFTRSQAKDPRVTMCGYRVTLINADQNVG